jgi:hypothetical protein
MSTEEQQKDLIFNTFLEYQNTICPDTQKYYLKLWENVYKLYVNYPNKNDNMGLAIERVIKRFIENISKIPKDKDGFFRYLNTSLTHEGVGSDHEYTTKNGNIRISNSIIKIPREKERKRKEIKDLIEMLESQLGRRSTSDEKIQFISKWYRVTNIEAIEYFELINKKNVSNLDSRNNDGEENNTLDTKDLKQPLSSSYKNPKDTFFENLDVSIIEEAVKFVLNKKQERARDCYKELFTLYCVKKNLKQLYPFLDQEIIDSSHKEGKKPKQYEIYLKYHDGIDKKSAEPQAATNLHEFLNEIKTYLKEKNI